MGQSVDRRQLLQIGAGATLVASATILVSVNCSNLTT